MSSKLILKELQHRAAAAKKAAEAPLFSKDKFCFPKQLEFIDDKSIIKTAVTSRRGGKSTGIAADFVDTCLNEHDVVCLYITLTFRSAKNIIWNEFKRICEDYKLNVKIDEQRLSILFLDTRSEIRCGGAKDESEIEKYRGWKLRKAYVDECQSFRPYLKSLVEDILIPGLRDLNGELGLTGTPGPVLAGLFYEYSINPKIKNYHWTAFDNPHMHNPPKKDLNKRLEQERDLRGILETDAGYQRETYGKWVEDKDALVFKFNKNINIYTQLPQQEMVYIFGMDIGWNDCDAIAVLGYNYVDNKVYLVEEFVKNHQTITDFVDVIKSLRDKYKPIKMVMDAGALGKKIQEEIKQRHGIVVEAADKHRKFEFIELLNDDLRTGRFKTFAGSRFEQDTNLVVWDNSKFGKREISDIYHTDIGDAVLYGFRECKHYYQIGQVSKPAINTNEYMDMLEEQEAEKLAKQMAGENDNVSDSDLQSVFDIYGNDDDFI